MTDGSNSEMPPAPACIRDPLERLSNNRVQSGYEPAWAPCPLPLMIVVRGTRGGWSHEDDLDLRRFLMQLNRVEHAPA